jgi:UDP-N-acetylmuramate--alanine ligase
MLGILMQRRRGLAVAGTHGKSTTAAMAAEIFLAAGCDPTYVYGAAPIGGNDGGRAGDGPVVLGEACEYQRNFLRLRPHDAVILNVEHDHFDCYPTREAVDRAFREFASLLPPEGTLVVPSDSTVWWDSLRSAHPTHCRIQTFGFDEHADWRAVNVQGDRGRYRFDLAHRDCDLGCVELSVYGRHNVLNALAAAALASVNGCPPGAILTGLSRFRGLRRRLERIANVAGITVWDDYAHHPTEIAAALAAIRENSPGARLICLFQPHQASRTARLLDELASVLQNAERVLIADIFRAREGPLPEQPPAFGGEVTSADLAARTRALGQEVFGSHALADIQQYLQTQLVPGDVLLVLGAGDIGRTAHGIVDWIRKHRAAG